MNKKYLAGIVLVSFVFIMLIGFSHSEESNLPSNATIYFFWAEGCPHCSAEEDFLSELESDYPSLEIKRFEVTNYPENVELLMKIAKELNIEIGGVPFTLLDDSYLIGWSDEEAIKENIRKKVECLVGNLCEKKYGYTLDFAQNSSENQTLGKENILQNKIKIPLLGEISIGNMSLPILTIVIAALDGFNPCAMWVLIFLISLLLGIEDSRKRWIFGIVFIGASALVYFIFLTAWLNFFIFLGFITLVKFVIGAVAIWAGYYNLREYFTNPQGVCKVTGAKKRQKIFSKLKSIVQEKKFIWAIMGLIVLAFAVNLVELICSAGLPAVFTQILAMNNLSSLGYYSYLILYILIFMLDDLIIFFIAMKTFELSGISSKYSRISHLIGGIVMLLIGVIMLIKPEILMFG